MAEKGEPTHQLPAAGTNAISTHSMRTGKIKRLCTSILLLTNSQCA